MGQTNNTIVVFTTDNGAETITFPDGGTTPFKGGKLTNPGIVKTTLDGIDQRDFLEGKSKSARDTFFYYSGKDPSAVRYKNWKMYFAMVSDSPAGFVTGVVPYHWTQVVNVRRDPFETSIGQQTKTLMGVGGALAGPVTAYQYDWNLLPMGQALWLKELETYIDFPPLQNPASYNLDQVMQQVKDMKNVSHAGE
jgi:arylsulfatase